MTNGPALERNFETEPVCQTGGRCPITEAYWRILNQIVPNDPQKRTYVELIAETMIRRALMGDIRALKEITDRVEGPVSEPLDARSAGSGLPNKGEAPTILKVVWDNETSRQESSQDQSGNDVRTD
jgi:hypothetical protein